MEIVNMDFEILTEYILTFHFYKYLNIDLIEDWTIELINSVYESEAIYNLACFYKPIDCDEALPYLEAVQREIKKGLKSDLLILDDFGLQPFDNQSREALLDIVDQRYNQASTIRYSKIPVSAWHDINGNTTIADAVLDRIVNSSHRINLASESMRKANF